MAVYRCFFTRGGYVPALQIIETEQDGEAITRATELLNSRPADLALEIWREDLLLARVVRAR